MESRARSPLDRLSDRERALVRVKLSDPAAPLWKLAKLAGYKGPRNTLTKTASSVLKRPSVVAALLTPPPTLEMEDEEVKILLSDPVRARGLLIKWYWKVVKSENTPQSERIRALNAVGNAVPGFNVPVGVHHSGSFTMEKFVELAGGKPPSEQVQENLPN